MLVIGLTGGIGTGKSEVSRILKELGAEVIDADRVGHEAYSPHTAIWREVVDTFGDRVLGPTGEIDRKRLGAIVFSDPEAMDALNAIMHPRMADIIREQIGGLREQGANLVVLEAALLIEAGWQSLVDEVWVTHATGGQVEERLRRRNGLTEEQIRSRVRAQMPFEERSRHAQVVVHNSGSLEELRHEVESLCRSKVGGKVG
jgi:dephospho-CoA kinase